MDQTRLDGEDGTIQSCLSLLGSSRDKAPKGLMLVCKY